jgi:hypothetical protein
LRKWLLILSSIAVVGGTGVAAHGIVRGLPQYWVSVTSVAVVLVGADSIFLASHRLDSVKLRFKRILALLLLPLVAIAAGAVFFDTFEWPGKVAVLIVAGIAYFGVSRITSLDVDKWVAGESPPPSNTSLERTREG